jgi:hypothetical protein
MRAGLLFHLCPVGDVYYVVDKLKHWEAGTNVNGDAQLHNLRKELHDKYDEIKRCAGERGDGHVCYESKLPTEKPDPYEAC